MRFLADENLSGAVVDEQIAREHEVDWIRTSVPGASDADVLAKAQSEGRILLTFDKDFGDLARIRTLGGDCGVVLLRVIPRPGPVAAARLADLILSRDDWAGHFSVIEPGRIRMRVLE